MDFITPLFLDHQCGPSTDSGKRYFGAKSTRISEKVQIFNPQNGDFSKMWPSSRFGLAMAVLGDHFNNLNIIIIHGLQVSIFWPI
jgi:hypothetical protein